MALQFSHVRVSTPDGNEAEFLVSGIPREFDDFEYYTAFEDFLDGIEEDTEISVHADAYLYGEGETFKASIEEVAYFHLRITDEKYTPKIVYLYNTYHDDMIRFARSRLKQSGCREYYYDAEDIAQECFVRITKYIEHVDFSVSETKLRSYVLSIVANQINTTLTKTHLYENVGDDINMIENENDFFDKLLIRERFEQVFRAMEQLDEIYKITLKYRYQNDMSVKEIAKFMGVPEKTVKTRLLRGRHYLINMLDKEDHKNGK